MQDESMFTSSILRFICNTFNGVVSDMRSYDLYIPKILFHPEVSLLTNDMFNNSSLEIIVAKNGKTYIKWINEYVENKIVYFYKDGIQYGVIERLYNDGRKEEGTFTINNNQIFYFVNKEEGYLSGGYNLLSGMKIRNFYQREDKLIH